MMSQLQSPFMQLATCLGLVERKEELDLLKISNYKTERNFSITADSKDTAC
jgi:hypothetical protein